MVFFVLSGYFVGGSVLRQGNAFSWGGYALARLSRLWTVLVPALVFTFGCDVIIKGLNPSALSGEYQAIWNSGPVVGAYAADARTMVGNLFFVQTIATPVFGSNSPLWSLANEFWYYVLFPLGTAVFYPHLRAASLSFGAAILAAVWFLPAGILTLFLVWLMGVVVYAFQLRSQVRQVQRSRYALVACLALFLVSLAASKALHMAAASADLAVGASFALLAREMGSLEPITLKPVRQTVAWLSDASYTVYLFHFPMVVAFGATVMRGRTLQPTATALAAYLLVLAGTISMCALSWFLFERQTPVVKQWMQVMLRLNSGTRQSAVSGLAGSSAL